MTFSFQYALSEISRYDLIAQRLPGMGFNWHVAKLETQDRALLGVGVCMRACGSVLVVSCHLACPGRNSPLF